MKAPCARHPPPFARTLMAPVSPVHIACSGQQEAQTSEEGQGATKMNEELDGTDDDIGACMFTHQTSVLCPVQTKLLWSLAPNSGLHGLKYMLALPKSSDSGHVLVSKASESTGKAQTCRNELYSLFGIWVGWADSTLSKEQAEEQVETSAERKRGGGREWGGEGGEDTGQSLRGGEQSPT